MSHTTNLGIIKSYLDDSYTRDETRVVPKRSDLTFGNTIKRLPHAVVVYVDMRGSRKIMQDATSFVASRHIGHSCKRSSTALRIATATSAASTATEPSPSLSERTQHPVRSELRWI